MRLEHFSVGEHGIELIHEARVFEVTSAKVTGPCLQAERKHVKEERDLNLGVEQVKHVFAEIKAACLIIST